jgi:hypothetical protein
MDAGRLGICIGADLYPLFCIDRSMARTLGITILRFANAGCVGFTMSNIHESNCNLVVLHITHSIHLPSLNPGFQLDRTCSSTFT